MSKPQPAIRIVHVRRLKSLTPPRHQPPGRIVRVDPVSGETLPQPHQVLGILDAHVEPLVVQTPAASTPAMLFPAFAVQLRVDDGLDPLVLGHPVGKLQDRLVLALGAPLLHATGHLPRPADLDGVDDGEHVGPESIVHVFVSRVLEAVDIANAAQIEWVNDQRPHQLVDLARGQGITVGPEEAYLARGGSTLLVELTLVLRVVALGLDYRNIVGTDIGLAHVHGYKNRGGDDLAV